MCVYTVQIYHGHSMVKQAGAKGNFRHESVMGHAIGPSTTVVYVYRQLMRKKKMWFMAYFFLLADQPRRSSI